MNFEPGGTYRITKRAGPYKIPPKSANEVRESLLLPGQCRSRDR